MQFSRFVMVLAASVFAVGCNPNGTCVVMTDELPVCVVNSPKKACGTEFIEGTSTESLEVCRSRGFTRTTDRSGADMTAEAMRAAAEKGEVLTMFRPKSRAEVTR
jgi:hypothetical protein